MTAIEEAWLDLRELHAAIEVERRARGLTWSQLQSEVVVTTGTIARFARDSTTEADGVMCLLDWLGLPAETFTRSSRPDSRLDLMARVSNVVRTHRELPVVSAREIEAAIGAAWQRVQAAPPPSASVPARNAASTSPNRGVTRIDALALHGALDARRQERGLTWSQITREMGFPYPGLFSDRPRQAAPRDLGRRGLGGRQEAHCYIAMAHWLQVPADTFLRRLGGRQAPSSDLPTQLARVIRTYPGLPPDAGATLEGAARSDCERLLAGVARAGG